MLNLTAGDGMLLGRLFKYLHRKEQIGAFLNAVVDNRLRRIESCRNAERSNPATIALPMEAETTHRLKSAISQAQLIALTEEVRVRLLVLVRLVLIGDAVVHP